MWTRLYGIGSVDYVISDGSNSAGSSSNPQCNSDGSTTNNGGSTRHNSGSRSNSKCISDGSTVNKSIFIKSQMVLPVRKRNRPRGSNSAGSSSNPNAAPMVLLRMMVALLGIILVLIRILSASPMVLLLISRSSEHLRWFY